MSDPFAQRREESAKVREEREASEKAHLSSLLNSLSGKWILSRIIQTFEEKVKRKTTGHNSEDSYHKGVQDHAREYRDLIINHFGHSALDKLDLKGKS